jgi:hypothetical protein
MRPFIAASCALLIAATPYQTGNPELDSRKKGPPVHTVNVKQEAGLPGWKVAALKGQASAIGHRLVVPSLDVMQPVSVMLVALDDGNIDLELYKDFEKPLKKATARRGTPARFDVRTMGPLRIRVSSSSGSSQYKLLVAVGDEIKRPVPSLFIPISMAGTTVAATAATSTAAAAQEAPAAGKGQSPVMWIIAGALVLIAAMLGIMLMRRNKSNKAMSILLAVMIPAAAVTALKAQGTVSQEAADYDPLKPEPVPFKDQILEEAEWVKELIKKQHDMAEAILDLYEALTKEDEELEPRYSGMPGIPTACVSKTPTGTAAAIGDVDWTGPCGECFTAAHDSISTTLQRFEKLRRVNAQTKEVYDKSLAFGDAAAGLGNIITAGEWQKIRHGIKKKMDDYNSIYDDKVEELSGALVSSLQKVAACEAQYFKNESWYERYGFMFVTPIVERHRR